MGNQIVIPSMGNWFIEPLKRWGIGVNSVIESGTFFITLDCYLIKDPKQQLIVKAYESNESLEESNLVQSCKIYFNTLDNLSKNVSIFGISNYSKIYLQNNLVFFCRKKHQYTLSQRLEEYPPLENVEKRWISYRILTLISMLHQVTKSMIHGAINPDNVFVTWDLNVSIGDMSPFKPTYIKHNRPDLFHHFFTTASRGGCYLAPEQLITSDSETDNVIFMFGSFSMDFFAAGLVIYYLYTGEHLLSFSALGEIALAIRQCKLKKKSNNDENDLNSLKPDSKDYDLIYNKYIYEKVKVLPDDIRDLVQILLDLDPSRRLSEQSLIENTNYAGNSFVNNSYDDIISPFFPPIFKQISDQLNEFFQKDMKLEHMIKLIPTFQMIIDDSDERQKIENLKDTFAVGKLTMSKKLKAISGSDSKLILVNVITNAVYLSNKIQEKSFFMNFICDFTLSLNENIKLSRILPIFADILSVPSNFLKSNALLCILKLIASLKIIPEGYECIFSSYLIKLIKKSSKNALIQYRCSLAYLCPKLAVEIERLNPNSSALAVEMVNFILNENQDLVIGSFVQSMRSIAQPVDEKKAQDSCSPIENRNLDTNHEKENKISSSDIPESKDISNEILIEEEEVDESDYSTSQERTETADFNTNKKEAEDSNKNENEINLEKETNENSNNDNKNQIIKTPDFNQSPTTNPPESSDEINRKEETKENGNNDNGSLIENESNINNNGIINSNNDNENQIENEINSNQSPATNPSENENINNDDENQIENESNFNQSPATDPSENENINNNDENQIENESNSNQSPATNPPDNENEINSKEETNENKENSSLLSPPPTSNPPEIEKEEVNESKSANDQISTENFSYFNQPPQENPIQMKLKEHFQDASNIALYHNPSRCSFSMFVKFSHILLSCLNSPIASFKLSVLSVLRAFFDNSPLSERIQFRRQYNDMSPLILGYFNNEIQLAMKPVKNSENNENEPLISDSGVFILSHRNDVMIEGYLGFFYWFVRRRLLDVVNMPELFLKISDFRRSDNASIRFYAAKIAEELPQGIDTMDDVIFIMDIIYQKRPRLTSITSSSQKRKLISAQKNEIQILPDDFLSLSSAQMKMKKSKIYGNDEMFNTAAQLKRRASVKNTPLIEKAGFKLIPKFIKSNRISNVPIKTIAPHFNSNLKAVINDEGGRLLYVTSTMNPLDPKNLSVKPVPKNYFNSNKVKMATITELKRTSMTLFVEENSNKAKLIDWVKDAVYEQFSFTFKSTPIKIISKHSNISYVLTNSNELSVYDCRDRKLSQTMQFDVKNLTASELCGWPQNCATLAVGFKEGLVQIVDTRMMMPISSILTDSVASIAPCYRNYCNFVVSSSETVEVFDAFLGCSELSLKIPKTKVCPYDGNVIMTNDTGVFCLDCENFENSSILMDYECVKNIGIGEIDDIIIRRDLSGKASLHKHTAMISAVDHSKELFMTGDVCGMLNFWTLSNFSKKK